MGVKNIDNELKVNVVAQAINTFGSQEKLAIAVNVTQQSISVWLKNGAVPFKKINSVSSATKIPKDILLNALFETANK